MAKDKNWKAKKKEGGITNQERADRVEELLEAYMKGVDGDLTPVEGEERGYCCDLIADLLHLAASKGWGAESVLDMANMHFQSER